MPVTRTPSKFEPGDIVYFLSSHSRGIEHARVWQVVDDSHQHKYTLDIFSKHRVFAEDVLFPTLAEAEEYKASIANK